MWSKEALKKLVEEYEKFPCMYNAKSPLYYNKLARNEAVKEMCNRVQFYREDSTPETVKKKLTSLRTQFVAEYNKVRASVESGLPPEEVYISGWWLYSKLSFLTDHLQSKRQGAESSVNNSWHFADDTYTAAPIKSDDDPLNCFEEQHSSDCVETLSNPSSIAPELQITTFEFRDTETSSSDNKDFDVRPATSTSYEVDASSKETDRLRLQIHRSSSRAAEKRLRDDSENSGVIPPKSRFTVGSSRRDEPNEPSLPLSDEGRELLEFLACSWSKIRSPLIRMKLKHEWLNALMQCEVQDLETEHT